MKKTRIIPNWIGSAWGVFFASTTALFVGAILGCCELILQKVEIVDTLPRNPPDGRKFYVQGNYAGSDYWRQKISDMARQSRPKITLTEGDINMFIQECFHVDAKKDTYLAGNVRMAGSRLHLGFILHNKLLGNPLCLQFAGAFNKGPDGFYFSPRRSYLGALPIPDFVSEPLCSIILHKTFEDPSAAGLVKGWRQLHSLSVENSTLRLTWE
jgi:hypothetical protein